MPLRDHFHEPLSRRRQWGSCLHAWACMTVAQLNLRVLPKRYRASPRIQTGAFIEPDYALSEDDEAGRVIWMPPPAWVAVPAQFAGQDCFEVLVHDDQRARQVVSVIEFVTPMHKESPRGRHSFAVRCAGHLQDRASLVLVDIVTKPAGNSFAELLDVLGLSDAPFPRETGTFAVACRTTKPLTPPPHHRKPASEAADGWRLEVWPEHLALASPLPTSPLWLADDLAVPLELEETYEEACRALRIA